MFHVALTRSFTTKRLEQSVDEISMEANNMNAEVWVPIEPAGYRTTNSQRYLSPDDRVYNWLSQSPGLYKKMFDATVTFCDNDLWYVICDLS